MTPVELAKQVYDREDCARDFVEDLELHLLNGYVFSTPLYFIMGRPVSVAASHEEIVDPSVVFEDPDCWHVYLAAGHNPFRAFLRLMPWYLPCVSWERENKLRFHRTDFILNRFEITPSIFSGHEAIQGRWSAETSEASEAGKAEDSGTTTDSRSTCTSTCTCYRDDVGGIFGCGAAEA